MEPKIKPTKVNNYGVTFEDIKRDVFGVQEEQPPSPKMSAAVFSERNQGDRTARQSPKSRASAKSLRSHRSHASKKTKSRQQEPLESALAPLDGDPTGAEESSDLKAGAQKEGGEE